jgi:hypothetical protein
MDDAAGLAGAPIAGDQRAPLGRLHRRRLLEQFTMVLRIGDRRRIRFGELHGAGPIALEDLLEGRRQIDRAIARPAHHAFHRCLVAQRHAVDREHQLVVAMREPDARRAQGVDPRRRTPDRCDHRRGAPPLRLRGRGRRAARPAGGWSP